MKELSETEVDKVLGMLDSLGEIAGTGKLTDIFKNFESKVEPEFRNLALASVKQDAAKAIAEGLEEAKKQMSKVTEDKDLLEKLKAAVKAQDDGFKAPEEQA